MKLVLLCVEVVLILKITNVESQMMPPQMAGMQFPQLPQLPQMAQMPMGGPMQMPPRMPMPGMPMPGMPMPGMPMGMPMSFMGQPKLPMVVMPYHNKKQDKLQKKNKKTKKDKRKKRKKKKYIPMSSSSDSSTSSSESSDVSEVGFRSMKQNLKRNLRARKHRRRGQVLTPVISYVTKDGYVVYQKKIKKDKAKDWLEMGNRTPNRHDISAEKRSSSEEMLRKVLRRQMDKVMNEKH